MRTIHHDFFPIYHDPDGVAYVLLGTSVGKPDLQILREGERIIVLLPDQLEALADVHIVPHEESEERYSEYRGYLKTA